MVEVSVPPSTTAVELHVRQMVTLRHNLPQAGTVASAKGSRIAVDGRSHRFMLEGAGGGFPTDAFDFSLTASFPTDAAWQLVFRSDALEVPFLMGVRLMLNTSHPEAESLLAGKDALLHSILFHSILEQMLLAVADEPLQSAAGPFPEGSIGAVLEELCDTYLGLSLEDEVAQLRTSRSRSLAQLQAAVGFLRGGR